MSEQEKIALFRKLQEGFELSTRKMLERKIKLGESVVTADSNGNPIILSAEEALKIFESK